MRDRAEVRRTDFDENLKTDVDAFDDEKTRIYVPPLPLHADTAVLTLPPALLQALRAVAPKRRFRFEVPAVIAVAVLAVLMAVGRGWL